MEETANAKGKPNPEPRTYGCIKCGSPISAYPPDDVHNVASRDRSSFLEAIEATYTCTKCNEVTRLYWGRPVLYQGIIVALRQACRGIGGIIGRVALKRGTAGEDIETESSETSPMSMEAPEELENRIYEYILENGGSIGVGRASEDLGIPADLITEAIERMTLDGRLKQYSSAEQAQDSMIA